MTDTGSKDCLRFEAQVLELVYDELPDPVADELRMHAVNCTSCREILDGMLLTRKLAGKLPLVDPGDALDKNILEAASRQAKQYSENKKARDKAYVPNPAGFLHDALYQLKSLFLSPVFGTATLAMLVFVLAVFFQNKGASMIGSDQNKEELPLPAYDQNESEYKFQEKRAPTANAPLEQPVREEQATPEATSKRYDTDKKTKLLPIQEMRDRGSSTVESPTIDKDSIISTPPSYERVPRSSENRQQSQNESSSRFDNITGGGFAEPPPDDEISKGKSSSSKKDRSFEENQSKKSRAPEAPASEGDELDRTPYLPPEYSPSMPDFNAGKDAYVRGDCETAVASFTRAIDQSSLSSADEAYAIYRIAGCEKRRGRFASALIWYDRLLTGYSDYRQRPQALFESAQCLSRLGKKDQAIDKLEELAHIPGWEDRAQAEIRRLSE